MVDRFHILSFPFSPKYTHTHSTFPAGAEALITLPMQFALACSSVNNDYREPSGEDPFVDVVKSTPLGAVCCESTGFSLLNFSEGFSDYNKILITQWK